MTDSMRDFDPNAYPYQLEGRDFRVSPEDPDKGTPFWWLCSESTGRNRNTGNSCNNVFCQHKPTGIYRSWTQHGDERPDTIVYYRHDWLKFPSFQACRDYYQAHDPNMVTVDDIISAIDPAKEWTQLRVSKLVDVNVRKRQSVFDAIGYLLQHFDGLVGLVATSEAQATLGPRDHAYYMRRYYRHKDGRLISHIELHRDILKHRTATK